jgi:hypothetical protein
MSKRLERLRTTYGSQYNETNSIEYNPSKLSETGKSVIRDPRSKSVEPTFNTEQQHINATVKNEVQ